MAEYYVIRDKNTGLYFRGKGANRWGKYYNQATIYRVKGTAEHSIKEIAWHGEKAEIVPIQIFENPTDIVRVVCCRDCKYWNKDAMACDTLPWVDSVEHANWYADDFCSAGERKDNDNQQKT